MPTRNVILTDRQAEIVEHLVDQSGNPDASEELRFLERCKTEDEARLSALREAAQVGPEDFDAGCYRNLQTREALREHFATLIKAALDRSDE